MAVINKNHRTLYNLEFKRSSDRNKDFLRVKKDEANEQHRSIIEALRAAIRFYTDAVHCHGCPLLHLETFVC